MQNTGALMSSITYKSGTNEVVVGTPLQYAAIHKEGGTIKAKNVKYLCIPAGRRTKKLMRQFGLKPRECMAKMKAAGYAVWPRVDKDKRCLWAKQGERGKPFVLFYLKSSVKIPKREFFRLDPEDERILLELMVTHGERS